MKKWLPREIKGFVQSKTQKIVNFSQQETEDENQLFARAQEYVQRGKLARDSQDEQPLQQINEEIVNDPKMQKFMQQRGIQLEPIPQENAENPEAAVTTSESESSPTPQAGNGSSLTASTLSGVETGPEQQLSKAEQIKLQDIQNATEKLNRTFFDLTQRLRHQENRSMIELTGEDGQKSWPIVVIFFGSERDTAKDEIKMLNSLEAEMEELATKINIVTTPQEAKKKLNNIHKYLTGLPDLKTMKKLFAM
ncbi:hypothetical protein LRY58_01025 [Candidatus Woesebacteria bacterium]|nr:hypothetical protein [Candidatus Woesebacteria bacterium]